MNEKRNISRRFEEGAVASEPKEAMHIRRAMPADREVLLGIWLKSVRATHTFVSEDDLQSMIPEVRAYLASSEPEFWVLCGDSGTTMGFMGMCGSKMQSLFLAPEFQRRSGGWRLVRHARAVHGELTVDVNDQNSAARAFYEACGFVVEGRSELDDQGRPYPLLHMRLAPQDGMDRSRARTTALARELLRALDDNHTIEPITQGDAAFDVGAAYRVSAEILRRRRARGEMPIGRKIGFTNRLIWPEYSVSAPMWAHVYDSTVTYLDEPAARLATVHLSQPRLEPEIVLHFAKAPGLAKNEAELLSSIDWIAHGFEIVQTHIPGWKFKLADTIADFGLHGALIVGPRREVADLGDVAAKLRTFTITLANGLGLELQGSGVNVLGSPLLAALHLLTVLNEQSEFEPVQAGEIVTTGTLVPPPSLNSGQTWTTELVGIELPGLRVQIE